MRKYQKYKTDFAEIFTAVAAQNIYNSDKA